jgi:alpha-tubulin suppressor-like RCC1 family protein
MHSLGLTDNGQIMAWGSNLNKQLNFPVLPQGIKWISISAGEFHSLGLTDNGQIIGWGLNEYGQLTIPY